MFPLFTIEEIQHVDRQLVGVLDKTAQGNETWVGNCHVGALMKEGKVAFGRWFDLEHGVWRFRFDEGEEQKLHLSLGEKVAVIDGYWGERVELVYDKNIEWQLTKFTATKDWDHEHCSICWEKITEYENREYFVGDEKHPVCRSCYEKHISPGDISFVPGA